MLTVVFLGAAILGRWDGPGVGVIVAVDTDWGNGFKLLRFLSLEAEPWATAVRTPQFDRKTWAYHRIDVHYVLPRDVGIFELDPIPIWFLREVTTSDS